MHESYLKNLFRNPGEVYLNKKYAIIFNFSELELHSVQLTKSTILKPLRESGSYEDKEM